MRKKRKEGRIVLAPMTESLRQISGADPPAVSIDKARERLGPELRRVMKAGWLDEDIVAAFANQDREDILELLARARSNERREQRENKLKIQQRKAQRVAATQVTSKGAPSRPTPTMVLPPPTQVNPNRPALPTRPPPLAIASDTHRSDAEQGSRPITRNRGIPRPD